VVSAQPKALIRCSLTNGLEEICKQNQKEDTPDMVIKNTPFELARLDFKADRADRATRELVRDKLDACRAKSERLKAQRLERKVAQNAQKNSQTV